MPPKKRNQSPAASEDDGASKSKKKPRRSVGYSQKFFASGPVEVNEADTEGKFIKLFNAGDKEISLGGWELKHTVDDQEIIHEFHRQTKIQPQGYVTVYSSGSDETPSLAAGVIVMRQAWVTGEEMTTELFNEKDEKQSSLEMRYGSLVPLSLLSERRLDSM